MSKIFLSNGLILSIVFFQFCSSLEKQPGTIGRQAELVKDLETKLTSEDDKKRFRIFLSNVIEEEKEKDKSLIESRQNEKESNEEAKNKSLDAGKWEGIRNTFFAILFIIGIYFLIKFGGTVWTKINLIK